MEYLIIRIRQYFIEKTLYNLNTFSISLTQKISPYKSFHCTDKKFFPWVFNYFWFKLYFIQQTHPLAITLWFSFFYFETVGKHFVILIVYGECLLHWKIYCELLTFDDVVVFYWQQKMSTFIFNYIFRFLFSLCGKFWSFR